jgi:hypothetical protein
MPRRRSARTEVMIDRIGRAIAKADGGVFDADPAHYRRLAVAAVRPIAQPTDNIVDAAHEAVWFDAYWAINNRGDFKRAVKAMIDAVVREAGAIDGGAPI